MSKKMSRVNRQSDIGDFMGQVSQEWFDSFNRECDREERELLRSLGFPIDKYIQELEDRIIGLVGYEEKK